jgi:hypothetical protein
MAAGTYYVKTNNSIGMVDQVYNAQDCSFCNPTIGNGVAVTTGQTTAGINFSLQPGGRVSGTVLAAANNAPLAGVNVTIFNSAGQSVGSGQTDGTGTYITFGGLPSGTYYAKTFNSAGLIDKIYDDIACFQCNPNTGKPFTVTKGQTTGGIGFKLAQGSQIAGTITDAGTSLPVVNAAVDVFGSNGYYVTTAFTGGNGQYVTTTGLIAGTYYARASSSQGYIARMYGATTDCAGCSPLSGGQIALDAATKKSGIDVALSIGGLISGQVLDNAS